MSVLAGADWFVVGVMYVTDGVWHFWWIKDVVDEETPFSQVILYHGPQAGDDISTLWLQVWS